MADHSGAGGGEVRYPRAMTIQGVEPMDIRHVFVEDGGVRIDNAGPFPPAEAARLHRWLGRYLESAREDMRRYRAAKAGR